MTKKPKHGEVLRGTWATTFDSERETWICDLDKLALIVRNWKELPKTLSDKHAYELALLADAWVKSRGGWEK